MSSPAQQSTTQTEFLKLVGGSIKIPVRSVPNTKGSIVRFLSPGNIIEVKVINSKGYYRLADDTGFVNKNTKNASWIQVMSLAGANDQPSIKSSELSVDDVNANTISTIKDELPLQSLNIDIEQKQSSELPVDKIKFFHLEQFIGANNEVESSDGKRSRGKVMNNTNDVTDANVIKMICSCMESDKILIKTNIEGLVLFILYIINDPSSQDFSLQVGAGKLLVDIIESFPNHIADKNLVEPTLACITAVIARCPDNSELFSFPEKDIKEDEKVSIVVIALILIEKMSLCILPNEFIPFVVSLCCKNIQSSTASMRKAGCVIIGLISTICSDSLNKLVSSFVPLIVISVADTDVNTIEMACFALGQFSEYFQPEILAYHSTILSALSNALDNSNTEILLTACYALELTICDSLSSNILPSLDLLLSKVGALHSHSSIQVQELAFNTLSSIVLAAEIEILPYIPGMCALIETKLILKDSKEKPIRGKSLLLLGHIAVAVGNDYFTPYINMSLQAAQNNISTGDHDLIEFSYKFYSNLAKSMRNEFSVYLPSIMPQLLKYISTQEDDDDVEAKLNSFIDSNNEVDFDEMIPSDHAKKAGIHTLGCIAKYTHEGFSHYINEIFNIFQNYRYPLSSEHIEIKGECYKAIEYFIVSLCITNGIKNELSSASGTHIIIPTVVQTKIIEYLSILFEALDQSTEYKLAEQIYDSIYSIFAQIGPVVFTLLYGSETPVSEALISIICSHFNPKYGDGDDDEDSNNNDDDDDEKYPALQYLIDFVVKLAKLLGPAFIPYFDEILPNIFICISNSTTNISDRVDITGNLGYILLNIGSESVKYSSMILDLVTICVIDIDVRIRQNAAYCVCCLIDVSGEALYPDYLRILDILAPISTRSTECVVLSGGGDVDNALSAMAKMIKYNSQVIPLDTVLPLMLSSLPLQVDMMEGPSVYSTLIKLVIEDNIFVIKLLPEIMNIFGYELSIASKATEETKMIIINGLKTAMTIPTLASALKNTVSGLSNSAHVLVLRQYIFDNTI